MNVHTNKTLKTNKPINPQIMKKAIYTIGLFSMLLVLTSFKSNDPQEIISQYKMNNFITYQVELPSPTTKVDESVSTISIITLDAQENDPTKNGGYHPEPPKKVDE